MTLPLLPWVERDDFDGLWHCHCPHCERDLDPMGTESDALEQYDTHLWLSHRIRPE